MNAPYEDQGNIPISLSHVHYDRKETKNENGMPKIENHEIFRVKSIKLKNILAEISQDIYVSIIKRKKELDSGGTRHV